MGDPFLRATLARFIRRVRSCVLWCRSSTRANRDWAAADSLRIKLKGRSAVVIDGTEGSIWRVKVGYQR